MSLENFLMALRALDPEMQKTYRDRFDPATYRVATPGGGDMICFDDPPRRRLGEVIIDHLTALPTWLKDGIAVGTYRQHGDVALGLLWWLNQIGHEVYGPAPDGRVFYRLAEAIKKASPEEVSATLDGPDEAILRALSKRPSTMLLEDLAAKAGYSRKTCGKHVERLIEIGYVARKSERSGIAITPAGKIAIRNEITR